MGSHEHRMGKEGKGLGPRLELDDIRQWVSLRRAPASGRHVGPFTLAGQISRGDTPKGMERTVAGDAPIRPLALKQTTGIGPDISTDPEHARHSPRFAVVPPHSYKSPEGPPGKRDENPNRQEP